MGTKEPAQGADGSRSFAVGDLIMSCDPFVWVLESSAYRTRCANCLQESQDLRTCSGCRLHRYCDVACQSADWKAEHKVECALLKKKGTGSGMETARGPSNCGTRYTMDISPDLIAKVDNKIKLNAVVDVPGLGPKSAKELWNTLPSNPKSPRINVTYRGRSEEVMRQLGIDVPEMMSYSGKIAYNSMAIIDTVKETAPIGLALYPPVSEQLMTPVCWDMNVVLSFRGRRLVIHAVEDIPNYVGFKDLRYADIQEPFFLTRAGRRLEFEKMYGHPCTCRKCTPEYEADINPLKCVTIGCANRIPSDDRALQPCARCGALNGERLSQFRRFMQQHETIKTGYSKELHGAMVIDLLQEMDAADILQPDAHIRYVCGWEWPRMLYNENRFEEGWKLMKELIVCARNIYPKYHAFRAMVLALAGVSSALALMNRVMEKINQLTGAEKQQLKTSSDTASRILLGYSREARDIFVLLYGEPSKEATAGKNFLARTSSYVRHTQKMCQKRK
ncbi:uncharacterized protein LOC129596092 [Paramacrobiotus metropolitanus]|uniref:uncharacterized protein LOC129596092 n=1 Tax=Paramacrobiotus metropolitanus TaxID=2943436 RepID=UPI0024456D57|nr:uncharacterized protein LOC129596092 [Paramacrobiotus metropolitanus]